MKPLPFVGTDEVQLTLEQYQLVESAVITAVQKPLVGRLVMPLQELNNFGIQQIKTYTQTEMGDAAIGMAMIQGAADIIGLTPGTLAIPAIWKDFVIPMRDLESSRTTGVPLDTTNAASAGRRIGELEETLIWEGIAGWVGFMGVVGRLTEASAGAWSTAANAYTDIKDALTELMNAGYKGRPTLVVTPNQWSDLLLHIGTTSDTVLQKLAALCNVEVAYYFADDASALMVMPDPENFQLKIGQNTVVKPTLRETGDLFVRSYEAVVPQFKRATSICEITGITV